MSLDSGTLGSVQSLYSQKDSLNEASVDFDQLDLPAFFSAVKQRLEHLMVQRFNHHEGLSPRLIEAMRYASLSGGKRIRPALIYATHHAVRAVCQDRSDDLGESIIDDIALAVELLHCYSLVHDDLPAMDDDDLRRGQPTCHRAFDEATAILAGDALQSLAFQILTGNAEDESEQSTLVRLKLVRILAKASGTEGMAAGQALDLAATGKALSIDEIRNIHQLKTGSLLEASVQMAAVATVSTLGLGDIEALNGYARHIGLAFQVQDDILDQIGQTNLLGKAAGMDLANEKATYPTIMGLDNAKAYLLELLHLAMSHLDQLSFPAHRLGQIASFIVERNC